MTTFTTKAAEILSQLRERKPLINHITNFVVMNDTANITLFVGAQPIMAQAIEEVAEITDVADALVLNAGNVTTPDWCEAMILAGVQANASKKPVIMDPVGMGATSMRSRNIRRLLHEMSIQIVRGNAGEIGVLSGLGGKVRGVDSVEAAGDPTHIARHTALQYQTVVALCDRCDTISDGTRVLRVHNGHHWLTTLTGTGCMATSVIAAFAAVEPDYTIAAACALAAYGYAAERAAEHAQGPASFRVAFFDYLYHLTPDDLAAGVRIEQVDG
jgi:hydroxyethylthiazole kinase